MQVAALDHQRAGRFGEAGKLYHQILKLAPANHDAWHLSGLLYYQRGEYDQAIPCIRRAIELNPRIYLYHYNLGIIYRDTGNLRAASDCFQVARHLNSTHIDTALNNAHMLRALGKTDDAIHEYQNILSRNPRDLEAARALTEILANFTFVKYDAGYEGVLIQLLQTGGVYHQYLARTIASLLVQKYSLADATETDRDALPEQFYRLASDPLFLGFLRKVINTDTIMEVTLTRLRSQLLEKVSSGTSSVSFGNEFIGRLAQQCLNNAQVFPLSEQDRKHLEALKQDLNNLDGRLPPAIADIEIKLLIYAMFEPLDRLSVAATLAAVPLESWSPWARDVVVAGLHEPMAERKIKQELESILSPEDNTSLAVRALYEESPYPRWLTIREHNLIDYRQRFMTRFPDFQFKGNADGSYRVLIAGCGTGRHPIEVAKANPKASVTAIDLSAASLAYAVKMARKLKVTNVRFIQGDILVVKNLDMTFDAIESVGVLHHMKNPLEGWQALVDCLNPGGLMRIGLYSEKARTAVVKCWEYIRERGLKSDKRGVDRLRMDVLEGKLGDSVKMDITRWNDFYSTNGIRDLLFHVMEHQYSLPRIKEALSGLGLTFIGFDPLSPSTRKMYQSRFGPNADLADLEYWNDLEKEDPDIFRGMYQFWCQKAEVETTGSTVTEYRFRANTAGQGIKRRVR